jgi:general secretion pathway protein H
MQPTSAIGHRPAEAGFSLVELLLVLAIAALVSTAVVLQLPSPEQQLRRDLERLAVRAAIARDLAIQRNRPIALRIDATGAAYEHRRGGRWIAVAAPQAKPLEWSQPVSVLPTRLIFDPLGITEPTRLAVSTGEVQLALILGSDGKALVP